MHFGAVVCCPRRVSLCRMQLPESPFGLSVSRGLGAECPRWLRGYGWSLCSEGFVRQSCFPMKENAWGVGFRPLEIPSKAAGPREPGATQPRFALWRAEGRGKNGLRCFPERGGLGLGFLPEESFPLQNVAARSSFWAVGATGTQRCVAELAQGVWFGPCRRRPSRPQSCFPTKEVLCVVGFGRRRPPAMQQGPRSRGSPAPLCPMESGGPWAKTACVAFLSKGAVGLVLLREQ